MTSVRCYQTVSHPQDPTGLGPVRDETSRAQDRLAHRQGRHQGIAAIRIELREHVIEQQHRRGTRLARDHVMRGEP